jgi:O-antigen ligase
MGAVTEWSRAARFFIITLYLGVFGLWLAGYLDRPNRARLVVRAYLVSALLSAAFTVAAELVSFPLHELFIGDNVRGKGLFKDPNVYGPFLIPIALIMAEEIFNPRLLRLRRSLKVASFLMLALGVLFSYSRAAWLNLTVGLLVLVVVVVVRRPDRKAVSLVLVLITAALTLAAAVVVSGSLGFLKERAKLQGYDTERFAAQDRGLSFGLHHIFGVGPGQFEVLSPVATHSLYIRSFAEQGVLGLAVIILIVLSTLVFALVNVVRGRDTYGISAAALLAAWCGLVCNSFFVDTMHWRHLWLVLGLIWAGAARTQLGSNWFRASALPVPGLPPVNGARSLDVRTD